MYTTVGCTAAQEPSGRKLVASEAMVTISQQNTLLRLLEDNFCKPILTKFMRKRLDLNRTKAKGLAT